MAATALPARRQGEVAELLSLTALATVTVASTGWAIVAAGWSDGLVVAIVCGVVAVLEAALITAAALGRAAALTLGVVLGLCVVVLVTSGAMPPDGREGLGDAILRYGRALGTGLFSTSDWDFLVGLCGALWALGLWTGWLALRERRGILAALPCLVALAVNVLNAPSRDHVALPEMIAVLAALLLVARTHLAALERSWEGRRILAVPGMRARHGRVAAIAALAVVGAAVLTPPASSRDVSGFLFRLVPGAGSGQGAGPGRGGSSAGAGPAAIGFSPTVVPGGPLRAENRTVLTYTTDDGAGVYLRLLVDDVFSHGNWLPGSTAEESGLVAEGGPLPRDRSPADGGEPPPSTVHAEVAHVQIDASDAAGTQHLAPFPGDPEAIDVAAVALGVPGGLGQLLTVDRVAVRPDRLDGRAPRAMTTVGTVSTATPDQLRHASTTYPPWVTRYTSLPTAGGGETAQLSRIRDLARTWAAGTTNPYDAATAIETHLRSEYRYTLTPPRAPAGVWEVSNFLFTTKEGYCQYFADAMGTMLRSLGIPARLVSGFGPGSPDDRSERTQRATYIVSSSDAHVWVEAYFPGYGWIGFEPTPPSPVGDYEPFPRGTGSSTTTPPPLATLPTPAPTAGARPSPSPTPSPGAAGAGGTSSPSGPPAALLAVAVLLVVVAGVGAGGWLWMSRARSLAALWSRVVLIGRTLGAPPHPAETDLAYARRLARCLPPDTVTVLHPDGSAPPTTRRIRDAAADALLQIAALRGKAQFSADGLAPREVVRARRAWLRLWRVAPLLVWRGWLFRWGVR